ncbi:oligosaccharide flippase family protein [Vibrio alginolyticus]|nr:oligosaccharide flippase family protein [Vibrio alginolyticus]
MSLLKGSVSWLVISNLATLSSFVVTIFSGSILTKEEFGAIGLIMLVVNILDSLKQIGVKEYLIATKNIGDYEENIAWTLDFVKGFVLFAIVCLVASIYELSEEFNDLNFYLFLLGFTFIFDSLASPTYYKLRKLMKYKELIVHNLLSNVVQASVAISLLLVGYTYEAIIIGYITKSLVFNISSYFFLGRLPQIKVEMNTVRAIFSYGGWLFVSGILFYVTSRLDNLIVAKYLSIADLGVYTFMYSIGNSLIAQPSKSISNALFPIISKSKDANYKSVVLSLASILFVVSIAFSYAIPFTLDFIFDGKWEEGYYVIKVMCFAMAINALKIDSYFLAHKKTKDKFIIELVRASLFLSLLIPMVKIRGINGAAEVTLVANLLALFVWYYFMNKRFNSENLD